MTNSETSKTAVSITTGVGGGSDCASWAAAQCRACRTADGTAVNSMWSEQEATSAFGTTAVPPRHGSITGHFQCARGHGPRP